MTTPEERARKLMYSLGYQWPPAIVARIADVIRAAVDDALEEARLRIDDTAPTLPAALENVTQGRVSLFSAYRESEDRLRAQIDVMERIVTLARKSYDVVDYPAEEGDLYKAIAEYDALLLAEKRRVDAYIRSLHGGS